MIGCLHGNLTTNCKSSNNACICIVTHFKVSFTPISFTPEGQKWKLHEVYLVCSGNHIRSRALMHQTHRLTNNPFGDTDSFGNTIHRSDLCSVRMVIITLHYNQGPLHGLSPLTTQLCSNYKPKCSQY